MTNKTQNAVSTPATTNAEFIIDTEIKEETEMKTIETKITKSGNVSLKINGERANIKTAARVLSNAMSANNNITVEIVNEAGEKFTYGGTEYKQSYTHYHFNNDNGKSFEIRDFVRSYNEIAEEAIRTIANMPEIEKVQAEYAASWERIKKANSDKAQVTDNKEETKMTIETKISANGSANIYVDGKKTANAAAVEIAEANGLPTYEARVYTYGENCITKEFATAIAAHKWLVGKMKRDIAASVEIRRWNNRHDETTIFEDADQGHTINADDEPEFANYIYPLFTAEHLEDQFDRMNRFAAHLTREGLTAEQINEVLTAQYANQNGNDHCKLIAEFKKANAAAEAATVTEVNAFNVETKITADNKVTFAHAGKKISLKKAVAQAVETDADYIRIINENGEQILYAMHDDCGWNPETSTNFYWNLKVFADDFARGKIDPKTGERKTEVKSVDFSDEADMFTPDVEIDDEAKTDDPHEIIIGDETVKFFNGKFFSVFSRKYHGAIVKTNGIISYCVFNDGDTEVYDVRGHEVSYDEFVTVMTERAEPDTPDTPTRKTDEPATETADKNVDAIGRIISLDVANANNQPVYEAEGRTRGGNFIANYFASAIAAFTWLDKKTGDAVKIERGHVSIARYLKDHGRELVYFADKDLSTIFANDEPEFKKFMSAYGDSVSDINEPYREPKITFEMCRFGTPKTTAEMKAELAEVKAELQELQTALEIEVCDDNADNAQVIAEKIVELNARYGHLYEQIYGHTVEIVTDPAQVIAAAIEITAIADEEQRKVFDETVAKIPAAELKAKYDACKDEDERVKICVEAYRNYIEPKIKQQERTIAEQVCASLTADAPQGWAVTFTDAGKYEVTAHGMSTATLDTITAGDFINPKEFFAQFNRTQTDINDEREIALAEARHEREQLLNMRAELAAEFPDEKERLKILDNMIAENSADIDALESLIWKPGMFDAKHLNEDNLPF